MRAISGRRIFLVCLSPPTHTTTTTQKSVFCSVSVQGCACTEHAQGCVQECAQKCDQEWQKESVQSLSLDNTIANK